MQLKRLFSYGIVGLIVSVTYVICTIFYTEVLEVTPIKASALAYVTSFMLSFFGNHHVVFKSKEGMSKTIVRFAVVSACIFTLTTTIMYLAVDVINVPYLYGVAVVVVVIPLTNYSLSLYWTFREAKH